MEIDDVKEVVVEAESFLKLVEAALNHNNPDYRKAQAGCRRASLDLTKALAKMRSRT